ncbi:MAG TPA: hypothetical protein P5323_04050 [Candidatus Moranbacteria bacterium]|nr:hypothetical protein [Candidatus Moranbacteria bacterium]HRY28282.1 hypothetical protein [Candidatus Moranbacteria bacterium]HSA08054.1 hypothetical protein [Candidatus Moranbacteria bacterium]
MEDLFVGLVLISLICFLLSWIIPNTFSPLFKNKLSKGKIRLVFGLSTIAFFILFGMISDTKHPLPKNQEVSTSQNNAQSANSQEKKVETKQLSAEEIAKKEAEDKAKQEALAKPHFNDGNYEVGTDIQPGTYRTRKGSSGCYYARLKGFSGSLGDIISNENTYYPAVVTIESTDKGFKSSGCGTWTQDLSAITTEQTTFNDGIFIVGTDILPGTYKSSGSDGCYYSRLKGFTGSLGNIIANENTDTSAIVTISSTDKGFKSSGCGTWTKTK